jgi:hypothetical protein
MIKTIIKYSVIILLSFIAGWIIKPKQTAKPINCPECPICPVSVDSIITIETSDTINLKPTIKKGSKTKSKTIVPELLETNTTTDQSKIVKQKVFTKMFDNGLVKVWDTITVQESNIIDWERSTQIDEVELNKLIKVVDKIVLEERVGPIREVPKLVYMPQRFISFGANGSYDVNGNLDYGVIGGWQTSSGLHIEGGYTKNKTITTKISFPILRLKQKD